MLVIALSANLKLLQMSNLKISPNIKNSTIVEVTPAAVGFQYVGFKVIQLENEQIINYLDPAQESCLTILSGAVDVMIGEKLHKSLGARESVFDPVSPTAIYLPPGQLVKLTSLGHVEIAISTAPATGKYPARVIEPAQMTRSVRGSGTNTRYVCDILPESAEAESLLVVEVITPSSHSSSYPPHKHDTTSQTETFLEETYYHMLNPPQGYAFQRVYTDDLSLNETLLLENRDTVLVPRGYHPCTVPHGYNLYYLNTMAGPERRWAFTNDAAHDWLAAVPVTTK